MSDVASVIVRLVNIAFSLVAVYFCVKLAWKSSKSIAFTGWSLALWSLHRAIFYASRFFFVVGAVDLNIWSGIITLQGTISSILIAYILLRRYGRN